MLKKLFPWIGPRVIGDPRDPYLLRWFVIPKNPVLNIYLHQMLTSDDARELHDHPWYSVSVCLKGRYFEQTPGDSVGEVKCGAVIFRKATHAHRILIFPGERATTLFITFPKIREWGFYCQRGWRHWTSYENLGCGD